MAFSDQEHARQATSPAADTLKATYLTSFQGRRNVAAEHKSADHAGNKPKAEHGDWEQHRQFVSLHQKDVNETRPAWDCEKGCLNAVKLAGFSALLVMNNSYRRIPSSDRSILIWLLRP
jgi:hypothetical protein